jgi:TonB family protein
VERFDQRQGFLISSVLHLLIMTLLSSRTPTPKAIPQPEARVMPPRAERVFIPPPEVLRRMVPAPAPTPPPVAVRPTPPPPERGKDRISIGPPSEQRRKEPLLLRREDDLTAVPKGRPSVAPAAPAEPPAPSASPSPESGAAERPGETALRLPPGLGAEPRGEEGERRRPGPVGAASPSIASSLRGLERRLQDPGPLGLPTGTGQQMGPLFFDPEGADFTVWLNHFKNEVYRNWIVPQPAIMGFRGHVDLEFTVERSGQMSSLRMLKSAGTPALDRAAQNALLGSRFLPLPADYAPPRVTMQVTFFYNESPRGS